MGYSIAMRAENKGLQKKMINFMKENYTFPHILFGGDYDYSRLADNYNSNARRDHSGLSYDHNRMAIGFDFNAFEPERDYIFAITRWMALKIGEKKEFKGLGRPVPYIAYDGGRIKDDRWPVLVQEQWEGKPLHGYEWCIVDSVGFQPIESKYADLPRHLKAKTKKEKDIVTKDLIKNMEVLMDRKVSKVNEFIHNELKLLDALWQGKNDQEGKKCQK